MTLSPLNPQIYDHLGAWLAMSDWRESLALSAFAWVGFLVFVGTAPHDLTRNATPAHLALTLSVYVPATLLVMRRRHRVDRAALVGTASRNSLGASGGSLSD
jgi:hypothetical protein